MSVINRLEPSQSFIFVKQVSCFWCDLFNTFVSRFKCKVKFGFFELFTKGVLRDWQKVIRFWERS